MPNIKSIQLTTKELLTYLCGYHGDLVIIATRYVADAYCPKEAACLIGSQYDKTDAAVSAGKASRDHFLSSEAPLVMESTSCYGDYLLLPRILLVII